MIRLVRLANSCFESDLEEFEVGIRFFTRHKNSSTDSRRGGMSVKLQCTSIISVSTPNNAVWNDIK